MQIVALRPVGRRPGSGIAGNVLGVPVAIGAYDQANDQTRTQTRTSGLLLAWFGYSQLGHARTPADRFRGVEQARVLPIPTYGVGMEGYRRGNGELTARTTCAQPQFQLAIPIPKGLQHSAQGCPRKPADVT